MSALIDPEATLDQAHDEYEAALDRAHNDYVTAQLAVGEARTRAEELRVRVASGDDSVSAGELASATAELEHAQLLVTGKEQRLKEAQQAVDAARRDEVLDSIVPGLRLRGDSVADALDGLDAVLESYVTAVKAFDGFAGSARSQIANVPSGPRLRTDRYGNSEVDGVRLANLPGHQILVRAVLPALSALGAPLYVLEQLKLVAAGAGLSIPTTDK